MLGTHLIEVSYKPRVADPVGRGLLQDIVHSKLAKVRDVRSGQLYRVVGNLTPEERSRLARDLLCDPVVQDVRDGDWRAPRRRTGPADAKAPMVVDVWYKEGVTDVVGESVLQAVRDLDLGGVSEVRTGARYRFFGIKTKAAAEKLALALLANPLVHDYVIHADE
jgi:phosphoribosylformylglycinamidine (FGAM) synthase PurS component